MLICFVVNQIDFWSVTCFLNQNDFLILNVNDFLILICFLNLIDFWESRIGFGVTRIYSWLEIQTYFWESLIDFGATRIDSLVNQIYCVVNQIYSWLVIRIDFLVNLIYFWLVILTYFLVNRNDSLLGTQTYFCWENRSDCESVNHSCSWLAIHSDYAVGIDSHS